MGRLELRAVGTVVRGLLLVEKLILLPVLQKRRGLGRCYALLAVLLGFMLFDAGSVAEAWGTIRALFGGGSFAAGECAEAVYQLRSCAVLLAAAAIGATPLPRRAFDALGKTHGGRAVLTVLEPMGLVGLLAVCTAYLWTGRSTRSCISGFKEAGRWKNGKIGSSSA